MPSRLASQALLAGIVAVVLLAGTSRQLQRNEEVELISLDEAKTQLAKAQLRVQQDLQRMKGGSKSAVSSLIYEPYSKFTMFGRVPCELFGFHASMILRWD